MAEATKAIFITGGGSGIGRAVAILFAARGWRVGLADIDAGGMAQTEAMLPDGMVTSYRMDVRDRAAWEEALAAFAQASGGRIDVLFNNAGIAVGGPFAETGADALERAVAINLMGVVNGAHIGFRYLRDTPGSCLLNTASAAALYGTPGAAIYSATKGAVKAFTEALDAEWAYYGIKVRSLMPSFIDTPLLDATATGSNSAIREGVRDAGLEFTPVEEVAQTAWDAVHGDRLHNVVGKTARRMRFASRWMPERLRKSVRGRGLS